MAKIFNVNGSCKPAKHYMVDLGTRLEEIKAMVDAGLYFTVHKARQYGKTTILRALADYLKQEYMVVSLDFQRMSFLDFADESAFVGGLAREIGKALRNMEEIPDDFREKLMEMAVGRDRESRMAELFDWFGQWCERTSKPIVLIIDEVDTAVNTQAFFDFLAQIRACYLDCDITPTFRSVILASLYDIRNIQKNIRPNEKHRENSPWNIAADFLVDMSFSTQDIARMLKEYEEDHHTDMDIEEISQLLYNYTSGYPYLVSRLCKLMDERIAKDRGFSDKSDVWTKEGFLEAMKILLNETNPLYQSLKRKLKEYPRLRDICYEILFAGKPIPYVAMNDYIEVAAMFGFIKNTNGTVSIANRIFETVLYNWFISEEYISSKIYDAGLQEKNQFITGGHLNVRRILEKFVESFDYLYGDSDETFLEDAGRRYFMLFLKPIINGVGNSYVEAETRSRERMDLVIDYRGEQFIIELKIWRGNAYNERGERQLSDYLDYFGIKKGYMLSFDFNKKKEIGVKEVILGDKLLIEAVV